MGSAFSSKKSKPASSRPKPVSSSSKNKRPAAPKKPKTTSGFYNYASDEPAWMKRISNSNISNWFYFFFVVNAILFVLSLLFVITHLTGRGAKPLSMSGPVLLAGAFSAVNTLFFYLLAERALD